MLKDVFYMYVKSLVTDAVSVMLYSELVGVVRRRSCVVVSASYAQIKEVLLFWELTQVPEG